MPATRVRSPRGAAALTSAFALALALAAGCGGESRGETGPAVVTFPGSAVGAEAEVLQTQLRRFMEERPDIRVVQRRTPDAADQRHQLYVQWLNAGASEPDILQLDVVWTAEFAAAGWILPLERFAPDTSDFFAPGIAADSWDGRLFALPWFADVGMLYWRTDLMEAPPASLPGLAREARALQESGAVRYGMVWQGARYEGLVTVFLEVLGGFGGQIMDDAGRVTVDDEPGVRALTYLCDAVGPDGYVPRSALTWHEEETRFAFQNGQAAFMRNWPYAVEPLSSEESEVAGRFSVASMPAGPGGEPTAALGGGQLAINANSHDPEAAWAVIEYLTRPAQMLERARVVGQYPTRPALYGADGPLVGVLAVPPPRVREIIEHAVPRPVTPVYTQLSEILQVRLHRALTGQQEPRAALEDAAREMRRLLAKVGLSREDTAGG